MLEQEGFMVYTEQSSFIENTMLCNLYARRAGLSPRKQEVNFERQFSSPYLTPASLADFLASRLPPYMFPAHYVLLPSLPLTANGKVDRAALQQIKTEEASVEKNLTPPGTEVEKILVRIWQEVLGMLEIGIHSNFFS